MSLPRDSNNNADNEGEKIDLEDLESVFTNFEKKRSEFAVGVEHERFLVHPKTLLPAAWLGKSSVGEVMHLLLKHYEAIDETTRAIVENEQIIGIILRNSSITVEPGGQLELSGAPLRSMSEIEAEIRSFDKIVKSIEQDLELSSLTIGFHPIARRENFSWVPKHRYDIMRSYMPHKGTRGHDMMLRTCTVQANFDYESEADMVSSFRLALLASPIVTALFATSPFYEGQLSKYLTERTMVWHDTDPDRCGFPQEVFESGFGYHRWIERALDTPMYFLRRGGRYINATTISFREFMQNGFSGFRATKADFLDHLTTIFTDARIKPQLEVRGADCGPMSMLLALPAFWKGLLYNESSKNKALHLLSFISPKDLIVHQKTAATDGLKGRLGPKKILTLAQDLIEISTSGLESLGKGESRFLRPLESIVAKGTSLSDIMRAKQINIPQGGFAWLVGSDWDLESL